MKAKIITEPFDWYDKYVWQDRINGSCMDIIGDVYYLWNYKVYLHRN